MVEMSLLADRGIYEGAHADFLVPTIWVLPVLLGVGTVHLAMAAIIWVVAKPTTVLPKPEPARHRWFWLTDCLAHDNLGILIWFAFPFSSACLAGIAIHLHVLYTKKAFTPTLMSSTRNP